MHASAHAQMARVIETYLPRNRHYTVVDFGSRTTGKQTATHRDLLRDHDCQIVGVDVVDGKNVDVVMKKPYLLPLRSNSVDVVVSGQVLELVPFF
ncbi:MAG: methyltransferase type 11, partial [Nocardioidaceae bacterium]|nr:methyltransferase type 11 [Nocardioidaceae bacterium]